MKVQQELIKNKNITIQRIFVIKGDLDDKCYSVLEKQYKIGIHVYFIQKNDLNLNPEWLDEDYLIQDDILLVDLQNNGNKSDRAVNKIRFKE